MREMNIVRAVAIVCVLLVVTRNVSACVHSCICKSDPHSQCKGGDKSPCDACCDNFGKTLVLIDDHCKTLRGHALTTEEQSDYSSQADNRTKFLVGYCYFCAILDLETALTGSYVALNDNGTSTCQDHSHGLLCGYCDDGYSRNLGGQCVCDNSRNLALRDWFFYIISQFVPITVWFFVLLFTGHSLVGGALNSAIFFAQMVTTTMDLDGDGFIPISNLTMNNSKIAYGVESVYHFVYEPFNLNFFYPFAEKLCLLKTPTYLPYVAVQYSVAFYPVALIGIVLFLVWLDNHNVTITEKCRIFFHGCLRRIPANFSKSTRDVFASFILLSYQKFVLISAMLLNPNRLIERSGDTDRYVLFYDPSVSYFTDNHITYAVIAVIIYMFALALPILLAIICYNKRRQRCQWINFFVEPFQRHYRKKCDDGKCCKHHRYRLHDSRWVAGVYFFLRLAFITIFILAPSSYKFIVQFVLQQLACIVVALFFVIYQPYKKKWHNKLDAFFLLLLAFINTLSIYQYFLTTDGKPLSLLSFVAQYVLIFVPFLWMVGCCVYRIVNKCRRPGGNVNADDDDDSTEIIQDGDLTHPPREDTGGSSSVHLNPSNSTGVNIRSARPSYGSTSNQDLN